MTRSRGTLCPCGHEKAHHTGPGATCVYGHGTATGGCVWCRGWGKKPRLEDDGRADPLARIQLCVLDAQAALDRLANAVRDVLAGGVTVKTEISTAADIEHVIRPRVTAGVPKEVAHAAGAGNAGLTKTKEHGPGPRGEIDSTGASSEPTGAVLRILTALTQHGPCTRRKLALVTGYSGRSGSFASALAKGRAAGWIEDDGELLIGKRPILHAPPLPRGDALLDHWIDDLSGAPGTMLATLATVGPCTRDSLARACEYSAKSGSFASALAKLRALELIDDARDGTMSLAKELRS